MSNNVAKGISEILIYISIGCLVGMICAWIKVNYFDDDE